MLSLKWVQPTKLYLYCNCAAQLRRSGQNSGTPQGGFKFGSFMQTNQMHEWAFISTRPCLPPVLGLSSSSYALQCPQLSSSNAPNSLHVFYISMVFGVVTMSPAFLCLRCGLWKKLVCSPCCAADFPVWPAKGVMHSHWAAQSLQTTWAKLDMLLLCCLFSITLHFVALHIIYRTSLLNEEPSALPTGFFLPSLWLLFFLYGGGYLVLIAKLLQKAASCGTSS